VTSLMLRMGGGGGPLAGEGVVCGGGVITWLEEVDAAGSGEGWEGDGIDMGELAEVGLKIERVQGGLCVFFGHGHFPFGDVAGVGVCVGLKADDVTLCPGLEDDGGHGLDAVGGVVEIDDEGVPEEEVGVGEGFAEGVDEVDVQPAGGAGEFDAGAGVGFGLSAAGGAAGGGDGGEDFLQDAGSGTW